MNIDDRAIEEYGVGHLRFFRKKLDRVINIKREDASFVSCVRRQSKVYGLKAVYRSIRFPDQSVKRYWWFCNQDSGALRSPDNGLLDAEIMVWLSREFDESLTEVYEKLGIDMSDDRYDPWHILDRLLTGKVW